jgi:hypothetical protein
VALPKEIKVDSMRDCDNDRLSKLLRDNHPAYWKTLKNIKEDLNEARHKQWK